ncbi:MAG: gliding motility-associated C-terminal domain-containing protein [Aquaticitalea sp.]
MKNLTQFTQINKILIAIALLIGFGSTAQIKQTFSPRYNQTVKGNVTIIANNMLSRSATGNYNGTSDNHDFTDNVYVDIDTDNTTFNSSSANFANPHPTLECLTIKKVLLYWAAADKEPNSSLTSENQPNWNYNDVKIMLPGQSTYTTLTATGNEIIYRGRDEAAHFSNDPFICVKDITTQVTALGNPYGKYQVANVEAKTGNLSSHGGGNTGTSGGWQVVFVYESPSLPRKNITLFDGYAHVTSAVNNFDINFNGFQTIPLGNVNADLVIGSLEGDRSLSGDRLQIRNVAGNFVDISSQTRSSSNFFNSSITIGGSNFVDRNPASTNTLGFDAAVFNLSNPGNSIITNNQTSAVLRLTSNQETYGLFLLGLAVDVYAPDLDPIQLAITGGNPVSPGDGVGFNFNVQNNGNDNAVNLAISTTLPPQVEFISANNLPNGVTYTYNPTTGNLTFNFVDGLADIGDPALNIDFNLIIKEQCYFLEDSCDLSFDLQFVATYNGIQNPALQNTLSSSGIGDCNVGNLLPLTVNINQPAAAVWATPSQSLDVELQCDDTTGLASAQALFPETDKCDFDLVKTSGEFVPNGGCNNTGTITNTWTFIDACGRTIADFVQVITIVNTTAANLTIPVDVTVECGEDTSPATAGTATASESCSAITITYEDEVTADCGNTVSIKRTWFATDDCGNVLSDFQTITVADTTPPSLIVPDNTTVECGGDTTSTTTGLATGSDTCGEVTITQSDNFEATCGNTRIITRTWTATDACGNVTSSDQIITVVDTTPPTLTVPADATVECGNDTSSASTGSATGIDSCGAVTITQTDTSVPGCGNTSTITRTWTAADACGNVVSADQIITVVDTTPPTLIVPENFNIECSNVERDGNDSGTATGTDTCGAVIITFVDSIIDGCGDTSVNTRTWTATDICGNSVSADQIISVTDTTAPIFVGQLPANTSVECDSVPAAETLIAIDNCGSAEVTFSETTTDGNCPSNYTIVRTWIATDECGLTATHIQTITVGDTTPPAFVEPLPENVSVECDVVPVAVILTATDNCGDADVIYNEIRNDGSCAYNYILIRTWIATDACGLTTSHSQTVTVQGTIDPILTAPATNIVSECDGTGNTSAIQDWLDNNGNATATDSCGPITWTNNYSGSASDCSAPVSVTFTATDECGNSVSTTATYTIQDSVPPVITGGASLTVECDGSGNSDELNNWLASNGGATATDDCSAVSWSNNFSELSNECGTTGSATVTFTATDGCGNSSSTTATFTIEDTTPPTIDTAATSLTVECDGNGNMDDLNNWLASQGGASASDSCSGVTWTNNFSELSNECGATGSTSVTFTATDECGNTATATATFTIEDTTPPAIDTPATSFTVECDGAGNVDDLNSWLASQGGASASDACSGVIWTNNFSELTNGCGETGSASVTFTATDECGNTATATATFTIEDTTPPTIDTSATNLTVECDGNGNIGDLNNWLASQGGASASDSCSGVTWTNNFNEISNECGETGSASVTFTATDECGNTATATATFTIEDTTPPTIDTIATNLTVECDGNGNLDDLNDWLASQGGASASDSCSSITWTHNFGELSNECGATGSASVTFTATDDCGNNATTTATFTIEDTTNPVLDIEATNIVVECDGSGNNGAIEEWLNNNGNASASDSCSATVTWTNDYAGAASDCSAPVSVTFTATDECGNSVSTTATYTIQDSVPPVISGGIDLTVECDGNGNIDDLNSWLASQGGATAIDDCSAVSWSNNFSELSNECGATGSASVTFTATDGCGNSSSTTATFTIEDTAPPTIDTVATNLTVECDGNGNVDDLNDWLASQAGASASDSCSGVTWTNNFSELSNECGATGSTSVTFTATDECGNTATTSGTFTIEDTTPPTIDTSAISLTVECNGAGNVDDLNNWLASQAGASASDACSNVTWTNNFSEISNECGETGSASVTFTATDECGNTATATAIFTIEDTTPPTIDTNATSLTVQCDGSGNVDELNDWLASQGGASASESCSNVIWTDNFSELSNECGATGSASVTFTATDECGNTSTTTATFTIEDTTPPTIDIPATNLTVECDGNGNLEDLNNWLALQGGAMASDTCSGVTWTNDYGQLSNDCGATGSVTVNFEATDDCGYKSITTGTFTIVDTISPTIDVPATNIIVECDGNENNAALEDWLNNNGNASASDACSNVTWTNDYSGSVSDCSAPISVIFTATDECGNSASTTATYTIQDSVPPVITGGSNLTVECDGNGNIDDLNNWLASQGGATATDDCSAVTWSNNFSELSNECGATGSATVTFTATDGCGNSSSTTATFTIEDTTPPTIETSATSLTVECDGAGNINDLNNWLASQGGASVSDSCSEINWTNDFTSLTQLCSENTGTAFVIFTATDECGNVATVSATFTIEDTTPPTIDVVAANQTVECDGSGNMTELNAWLTSNGGAVASETCSNVTWTNDFTSLTQLCSANTGTATVNFTATDNCGNLSTTTATFTINDTTPPTIDIPADNLTVECDGNGNLSELNDWLATLGGASSSDSCSNVTWTNNFTSLTQSCGTNTGSASVTFTATDECGNMSTTTATFTIDDTTPPTIDIPADHLTVECDGAGNTADLNNWLAMQGGASSSDSCSNVTWTNNFTSLTQLCSVNTGTASVTFTATDACGNSATTTATFTIEDSTPPTITTEAVDKTVQCDGTGNQADLANWLAAQGGAIAAESCSNVTWTHDYTALTPLCSAFTGTAIVEFTATDDCGNFETTRAIFTIIDTTPPLAVGNFDPITVNCGAIPDRNDIAVSFQDACSNNITVIELEEVTIGDLDSNYQIVWEWEATDECGNSSIITQLVNVTVQSTLVPLSNDLCQDAPAYDLNNELPAGVDTSGTWEVTAGDATLNGSVFDQSNADFGDYIFTYTESITGQCPTEYELTITVIDCIVLAPCDDPDNVIISTTVTPNGDLYNENFTISGIDNCNFTIELQIFNRWGAKIYENFNYQNDWNGVASKASIGNSDKVPTGTYYYIINLKNSGFKPFAGPIYVATK